MSSHNTITVELKDLHFFAFHGVYEEERKTGNEFKINLRINFVTDKEVITHLHDTVNYVRVYNLVKEMMQHPEHLLETIAMKIADRIHHEFEMVKEVELQIIKLHPPIANFTGKVAVTFKKEF